MYFKILCSFVVLVVLMLVVTPSHGQTQDTSQLRGYVENADNQVYDFSTKDTILLLNGNVRMSVDSTSIYCDTARVQNDDIFAFGNVALLRHDTVRLFSDTLAYDGALAVAEVTENVVIESGTGTLYTSQATYDLGRDVAYYRDTALITNGVYKLKSKTGRLYTKTNDVELRSNVTIEGENTYIITDSLDYNIDSGEAVFLSPMYMEQNDSRIYARKGEYNTSTGNGMLQEHVEVVGRDVKIAARSMRIVDRGAQYVFYGDVGFEDAKSSGSADTLLYNTIREEVTFLGNVHILQDDSSSVDGQKVLLDRKSDNMYAQKTTLRFESYDIVGDSIVRNTKDSSILLQGNVSVVDTVQNLYALGQNGVFQESTKAFVISDTVGQALFMSINGADTLYTWADTLSIKEDVVHQSKSQSVSAYRNVSILGKEIVAVCDSLHYDGIDSTFVLYDNPIMWGDSTQFEADTICIRIVDDNVDQVTFSDKTLAIFTEDMQLFSTIQSRSATLQFENQNMKTATFRDNVQVHYYLYDDGAYMGLNSGKGHLMVAHFSDKEISSISYNGQQDSELIPMDKLTADLTNNGHRQWQYDKRPTRKALEYHGSRIKDILEKNKYQNREK